MLLILFIPWPLSFEVNFSYVQLACFRRYFRKNAAVKKSNIKKSHFKIQPIRLVGALRLRRLEVELGNQTGDFDTDLCFILCLQAFVPGVLAYLKAKKVKADVHIKEVSWRQFSFKGIITFCLAKLIWELLRR